MRLITVIYRYLLLLSLTISLLSCEDYLSVELNNAISMDEVFNKRQTTEQYLAQVYGFLPNETDVVSGEGSVIPRSDEGMFSWLSVVACLNMDIGSWGPTTGRVRNWERSYQCIQHATIFMDNVHKNVEIDERTKEFMKAEARFIKPFLYFNLLRNYGPVYIWGDQ